MLHCKVFITLLHFLDVSSLDLGRAFERGPIFFEHGNRLRNEHALRVILRLQCPARLFAMSRRRPGTRSAGRTRATRRGGTG